MGQQPVATFALPLSTGPNVQNATPYKGNIDGCIAVMARIGDSFAAHANSTPDMRVYLDPGHLFTGTTLTEVGAYTQGTVTNGSTSVAITGGVAGISGTMLVSGPGIPANTTGTISGTTVTLSNAVSGLASSPQTNAPLVFMQRTAAITAPVSNSRIDRVVVDRITGAVSVITGTPGASPAVPALTAGVAPVAQVLLTSSSTSITNSMITDERDLALLGTPAGNNVSVASATTCDIGAAKSDNILVTGTTTITGFGSSASTECPIYFVKFSGALTLTYNASSLILPTAANIITQANDNATLLYLGSGNWQVVDYQRANGVSLSVAGTVTSIASATTTDLGSIASNFLQITGTTTITGFGSSAQLNNPLYFVRFNGALTLTYNATSLILPTSANISAAAGDFGIFQYLGSGNWQCLDYMLANGQALAGSAIKTVKKQTFTSGGTYTPSTGMVYCIVEVQAGGAAASNRGSSVPGVGGGSGSYSKAVLTAATVGASQTVTIGAATAQNSTTGSAGITGNTSSFGAIISCPGGVAGPTASAAGQVGAGPTAAPTGGDLNIPGRGSDPTTTGSSGPGADSFYGRGGQAVTSGTGINGTGYGSGGSGSNSNGAAGGNGQAGVVYITEFCTQ